MRSNSVKNDFSSGLMYKTTLERKKLKAQYSLMKLTFNEDGTIKKFSKDNDMMSKAKLRCGFHAIKTTHLYLAAEETHEGYGYRDEQEKEFRERKSDEANYRIRAWNELGKRGRNFIWFIGLILECYIKKVREASSKLQKMFPSHLTKMSLFEKVQNPRNF